MFATILIADDDTVTRITLEAALKKEGYTVYSAENGQQAVELGLRHQPNLAILDLDMPIMSGMEAARKLRDEANVPFICLSGYDSPDIIERAIQEGALGYLVKPIHPQRIVPTIKAALERAASLNPIQQQPNQTATRTVTPNPQSLPAVAIAVGIIMSQAKTTPQQAYELLTKQANYANQSIDTVANILIDSITAYQGILDKILSHQHN